MPVNKIAEVIRARNSLLIGVIQRHHVLFDTGGVSLSAVIAAGDNPHAFQDLTIGGLQIGGPLSPFPQWTRSHFQTYRTQRNQNDSIDLILGANFLSRLQVLIFSQDGIFQTDNVKNLESWRANWQEVEVCKGLFPILQTNKGRLFFDSGMAKSFLLEDVKGFDTAQTLGQPDSYFYSPALEGEASVYEGNLGIILNANDGTPIEVTSTSSAKTMMLNPNAPHQKLLQYLKQHGFSGFLGCDLLDEFDIAVSYSNGQVFARRK